MSLSLDPDICMNVTLLRVPKLISLISPNLKNWNLGSLLSVQHCGFSASPGLDPHVMEKLRSPIASPQRSKHRLKNHTKNPFWNIMRHWHTLTINTLRKMLLIIVKFLQKYYCSFNSRATIPVAFRHRSLDQLWSIAHFVWQQDAVRPISQSANIANMET